MVSIKFFVMGGVYDSMIDGARRLRTTLDEYQAPVSYLEVSEGHNTNTFRGAPRRCAEGVTAVVLGKLPNLNYEERLPAYVSAVLHPVKADLARGFVGAGDRDLDTTARSPSRSARGRLT